MVSVDDEALSDKPITNEVQERIWDREDEMEYPPTNDEDQTSSKKKGHSKRR